MHITNDGKDYMLGTFDEALKLKFVVDEKSVVKYPLQFPNLNHNVSVSQEWANVALYYLPDPVFIIDTKTTKFYTNMRFKKLDIEPNTLLNKLYKCGLSDDKNVVTEFFHFVFNKQIFFITTYHLMTNHNLIVVALVPYTELIPSYTFIQTTSI